MTKQMKYDCVICDFQTNIKKTFISHVDFSTHREAAMKKMSELK